MRWARSRVLLGALAAWLLLVGEFAGARPAGAAFGEPARARGGMVVSAQVDATQAGVAMLEAGGNAIDAAVATAFALSVTTPFSSGLGGGAFILMRLASGETLAIDCRETAPAAATRDMYLAPGLPDRASRSGPLAVATPGLVAGLARVQERHGTLPLAQVMAPAIVLAAEGFEIGTHHARMLGYMARYGLPERFPETGRIQFPPGGQPAQPGWRLVQSDLADSLRAIAEHGPEIFYSGALGQAIADHMAQLGGLVTREDLAGYRVAEREPVRGSYRGYTIDSFPPPSSGGVALIEILNIIEGFDMAELGLGSSASLHRIGEAMKLAFADRAAHLGDTDFVDVPVARLISKPYAEKLRAKINPPRWRRAPWTWGRSEVAISVPAPGLPQEDGGTTHLSTSDAAGNAVAITKTINTPFGSGITVPGTGIVLNNEMDDFAVAPYSPNAYGLIDTRGANAIAPHKRPLSSMTPTLVSRDGKVFMVTGSPGGPRIISTTLLSIVNVIDYGMNVRGAVSQPRFHHQWVPDSLRLEPAFAADVVDALVERGHEVEISSRNWSAAEAIVIDPDTGIHYGGSDPRRDGLALGPAPPTPR